MLQRDTPALVDSLPKQSQPAYNVKDKITQQLRQNFVKQGLPEMKKRRTDPPKQSLA